ncbi:hypothetical protein Tco_1219702 [Tanacetum coccineum]
MKELLLQLHFREDKTIVEKRKSQSIAEEEATKAALIQDFDDIQARIEADRLLATRLQEEERETFIEKRRAKYSLMILFELLKEHVGGKKHADLKNKNFKEIQVMYKKVKRYDKDFIAIGSARGESTKKRKSGLVKMIARKRPRPHPDDDSDDEHRKCLKIVTFDSTIDSEN